MKHCGRNRIFPPVSIGKAIPKKRNCIIVTRDRRHEKQLTQLIEFKNFTT